MQQIQREGLAASHTFRHPMKGSAISGAEFYAHDAVRYGVWRYKELRDFGLSRRMIERAVREGVLDRVRRGVFVSATANRHPAIVLAARLNARVGCLTACRIHGIWVPHHAGTHLVIHSRSTSLQRGSVVTHRQRSLPAGYLAEAPECILHVLKFHSFEEGLIVLESAVNQGKLDLETVGAIARRLPRRTQDALRHFDPKAQSGTETRVRLFLQQHGVSVRSQVYVEGVGRVDLLVGGRLIVELDSRAHHSSAIDYEEDRRRDMFARMAGFDVIRLSYEQVWDKRKWPRIQQVLLAVVRSRKHRRDPVPVATLI